MSPTRNATTATALAAMLMLAGCYPGSKGSNESAAGGFPSGTTGTGAAPADRQAATRLNAYTAGYNKLVGTFGLTETARSYVERDIPGKSPSDNISITDGWIDQALAKLKEARAMPGAMAELDGPADTLIAALDKVMARLGPLDTYYDSKAYKDDGLARGRREDPLMRAEFEAALSAMRGFDRALTTVRRARLDGELARLRASGNTLGYNTKLELKHAEDLLALFPDADAIRNPANYARGDALVAQLEPLLAEQRAAYAAAKARAGTGRGPDIDHDLVVNYLTSLIGSYREMRESKDPDDFNSMVRNYNSAIDNANDID